MVWYNCKCPINDLNPGPYLPAIFSVKTENSILKTLAYFDMFLHPLKPEEIRLFLDQPVATDELVAALDTMLQSGHVFRFNGFYSLRNEPLLMERRVKGNELAEKLLQTAYHNARFLQNFPFVRGVGISGSLSKNYADAGTDIDFFIITRSNSLWLARTFLHFFKKLTYLAGKQHGFCMNYFIDEEALQIAEKNIFTATEVVTLVPVCGNKAMADFFAANNWVLDHLPAQAVQKECIHDLPGAPWYKAATERVLQNKFGRWLDDRFMEITAARWKKKESRHQKNMKGDPIGLKISKHCARPNPEHLQKKLLGMLSEKLNRMEQDHLFRNEMI